MEPMIKLLTEIRLAVEAAKARGQTAFSDEQINELQKPL